MIIGAEPDQVGTNSVEVRQGTTRKMMCQVPDIKFAIISRVNITISGTSGPVQDVMVHVAKHEAVN